ncbi:MAG: serine hydrolase [Steroidobacteraceae bacterium]
MTRLSSRVSASCRCVLALLVCASPASFGAPPADLDAYAQGLLTRFETPGMLVVVVERGQPAVVRGYGVRRAGTPAKVDGDTLFAIGSTTKAFTGAVLSTMVDEGKLAWDSKVVDLLPGFRMYDSYASAEMTVRDLLVHRSGLGTGTGDLLYFPPSDFSRADIVHKLRYLPPASSFRSTFAYTNIMYVVAGEVIDAVGGAPWEQQVRDRILTPLGMNATTTTSRLPADANRAWPHARIASELRGEGPVVPLVQPLLIDSAAAAGAINSNGNDIARWLEVQLGRGLDPRTGKRLWSEAQAREMWAPQMIVPVAPNPKPIELAQAHFKGYAHGWIVSDYRGEQVISHGGGVSGMVCQLVILPGRDVAFGLFINSEEAYALGALRERLLDHYLGLPSPDWASAYAEVATARVSAARESLAQAAAQAKLAGGSRSTPSLPLDGYVGKYQDAWYGGARIERDGKELRIAFDHTPALSGPIVHVRYDTFLARWPDRSFEDAYVTFQLGADGSVESMKLRPVSPIADFSFDYGDLLFKPVR